MEFFKESSLFFPIRRSVEADARSTRLKTLCFPPLDQLISLLVSILLVLETIAQNPRFPGMKVNFNYKISLGSVLQPTPDYSIKSDLNIVGD